MFVNHKLWVIDQSDNFFMVGLLYLVHCLKGLTKGSVENFNLKWTEPVIRPMNVKKCLPSRVLRGSQIELT